MDGERLLIPSTVPSDLFPTLSLFFFGLFSPSSSHIIAKMLPINRAQSAAGLKANSV
jgi:hypothetical protein